MERKLTNVLSLPDEVDLSPEAKSILAQENNLKKGPEAHPSFQSLPQTPTTKSDSGTVDTSGGILGADTSKILQKAAKSRDKYPGYQLPYKDE